jgi:thioredoxin 1
MMPGNVKELDQASLEQALAGGDKLLVVEFYTTTCVNCAALAPIYEELSSELKQEAVFARINANVHPSLAAKFGIMGVPTIKFFCRNRPIGDIVGEVNTTLLRNTIKDFIRHRNECLSKSTPIHLEIDGYG